jgi:hypothetical protein
MDEWMKFYYEILWKIMDDKLIFNFANDAKWLIIEGHDPHKCPFSSNYDYFINFIP